MLLRGRVVVAYVLASCCIFISITNGQQLRNGHSKDAGTDTEDLDAWELARQNRITHQILQNYLEKRLFPHLSRMTRVPSVWEILPTGAKRPKPAVVHQNNIQEVIRNLEKNNTKEQLQSVETEQVSSFYEDDEDENEDCPNCVDEPIAAPVRWTMPLLKLGEKRYYLGIFFRANWFRASQYCRFHGMHLASISSQEENDKLEKHIKEFGFGHEHFWTSGTDLAEEGNFFWMSTGRPITFENWNTGEPNNFRYENGEEENCLELWNRDGKGLKWNDSPCSFETYFVCEV